MINIRNVLLTWGIGVLATCSMAAQTPVLGNLEAPYPNLQNSVRIAGGTYGSGATAYGPVGTPLVLTGSDLGASGTVLFTGYKNGAVDSGTTVQATVTMWSPTMLFLTVPSGAVSGLVTVNAEGRPSINGMPFIVTPGVYSGTCPASPPTSQLQITTASLKDGTAGQPYSATLNASGGTHAYTWSLVSGSLPGGLSLNASTGTISGTPTGAAGPMDLTFQVADSSSPSKSDQAVLRLTVEAQTLTAGAVYSYSVPSGGFDGDGNITQLQDSIMGSWTFSYDTLNRLVSGAASSGDFSGQSTCWSYDAWGNRTSQSLSTTACGSNPPAMSWATYTSSNTNRMDSTSQNASQSSGYDQAGNVTSDGINSYTYDAEGRVCAVRSEPIPGTYTMTGYLYDADGNRVAKGTITAMSCNPGSNGFQLTQSYVLGQSGETLTSLDGGGNWLRTNVYAAGKLMATYDATGLHFHLTDPLGTRRMQTNAAGQPETDIQSLPFGDQLYSFTDVNAPSTADDSTPLHFTGKERDSESGNDYFGARYYGSWMGRFMSPDYNEAGSAPVPYADFTNPQSLNLYAYVNNNPLTTTDADGHGCFDNDATSSVDSSGNLQINGGCDWGDILPTQVQVSQFIDQVKNAVQQVADYLNAPRDQGCMNMFAGAGAVAGAGIGVSVGSGIGATGGGIVGFAAGGVGAIPGGIGGGITGGIAGGAVGAGVGGAGGAAVGYFACASGNGGSSGSGGGSNAKAAKKLSTSQADAAARQGGYKGAEDLKKAFVGEHASQYDLYKQPNGDVEIFAKGGVGEGIETGINIKK